MEPSGRSKMTYVLLFSLTMLFLSLAPCSCTIGGWQLRSSRSGDVPPTPSWDLLTPEHWSSLDRNDAYFIVRRLRSSWLMGRRAGSYGLGSRSIGEPQIQVYVDGVRSLMGTRYLKTIRAQNLLEVRHLSPINATTRFGTDHGAGAILVTTKAGLTTPGLITSASEPHSDKKGPPPKRAVRLGSSKS